MAKGDRYPEWCIGRLQGVKEKCEMPYDYLKATHADI